MLVWILIELIVIQPHHPREPLALERGTTFTFVTDGIEAALDQEYLRAALVDEMEIHLVPFLLAGGERLFGGTGTGLHGLELVRAVATPRVTHLKFTRS
jgi:hypothetical protein